MEEAEPSSSSSPNNRLKFLCSYGGRILPRPSDNHLRYAGGDTRVLTVPRSITFTDLKEKIAAMFRSDVVVKYQLLHEDLDALVSVRNDEDISYMIDEYDRFARRPRSPTAASAPLFRLFLFPSPAATYPAASPRHRYLDAINGGLPLPILDPRMHHQHSPTSADCLFEAAVSGVHVGGARGGMGMHRVRSTPNLGGGEGNGGSQTSSPTAYRKPGATFGYGCTSGLKMGGGGGRVFRQEVGCGCGCGCACSAPLMIRKYVCSPVLGVEGSPPRRGNQRFHVGPPPLAAPMRKVVWE